MEWQRRVAAGRRMRGPHLEPRLGQRRQLVQVVRRLLAAAAHLLRGKQVAAGRQMNERRKGNDGGSGGGKWRQGAPGRLRAAAPLSRTSSSIILSTAAFSCGVRPSTYGRLSTRCWLRRQPFCSPCATSVSCSGAAMAPGAAASAVWSGAGEGWAVSGLQRAREAGSRCGRADLGCAGPLGAARLRCMGAMLGRAWTGPFVLRKLICAQIQGVIDTPTHFAALLALPAPWSRSTGMPPPKSPARAPAQGRAAFLNAAASAAIAETHRKEDR